MSELSQVCHRKQTTTVTEATVLLLAWVQSRYFQALGLLFKKLKQKFAHLLCSSRTLFKAMEQCRLERNTLSELTEGPVSKHP